VSALDEAQEAQMKAEEAIDKAHDDISAAEKDLAQVSVDKYSAFRKSLCAYKSVGSDVHERLYRPELI
jgi:hypothetical protein